MPRSRLPLPLLAGFISSAAGLMLLVLAFDALQLPLERPLYGNEAPEPVGSEYAQTAMGKYLNNRASTIFGGSDEVQKNIIAKTMGL
mgnify:CR=1 FL=1